MLGHLNIKNVYIYISDATRMDFAPLDVVNRGLSFRTIASSIHSSTSIASIVSGTYLPQHNVGEFSDTLPSDVPNLLKTDVLETGFANTMNDVRFDPGGSEDLIAETLDIECHPPNLLSKIDSPFLFVERGPGGHAPYVEKHDLDTGQNYFRNRGVSPRSRFASEYRQAIQEDTEWFKLRLETLEDRSFLEDTLVIYTSDHGEMLGESGMQSHSPPIHPRHVYVPTVLIHPDLPEGRREGGVLRHVDIMPTVSSLLDFEWSTHVVPAGRDLTTTVTADHGCCFYQISQKTPLGEFEVAFDSSWDRTGGYVFPRSGLVVRLLLFTRHMLQTPWRRFGQRHIFKNLVFKLRGTRCHWSPALTESAACDAIKEVTRMNASKAPTKDNVIPTERLRELGYIR